MGDPAWVAIVVTIFLAIVGGFGWIIRKVGAVENRLSDRIDGVDIRQTKYRDEANNKITNNLAQLEDKIDAAIREADRAHRELLIQVRDMALTMHDNFVSKPDLREDLKQIHDALVETRKEIGAVHTRVDDLYKIRGVRD